LAGIIKKGKLAHNFHFLGGGGRRKNYADQYNSAADFITDLLIKFNFAV
jgi:hypothetical protein